MKLHLPFIALLTMPFASTAFAQQIGEVDTAFKRLCRNKRNG